MSKWFWKGFWRGFSKPWSIFTDRRRYWIERIEREDRAADQPTAAQFVDATPELAKELMTGKIGNL